MDRSTEELKWKALRERVKETWGDVTDEELDQFQGQREQFVGHIEERYGMPREDVERRLDEIDRASAHQHWDGAGGTA